MQTRKIVCFFIALLLLWGLIFKANALSMSTISLHGVRLTVELTFPDEASSGESIWHNATITANTMLFLRNLTVVIKAPINSNLQEVFIGKDERNILMEEDSSFPWFMGPIILPEGTNGKLNCFIYVNTSQSADYAAFSFYTTLVSDPTFSEIQQIMADYITLQANYTALLGEFDSLLANYTTLLDEHNQLIADYNSKVATYNSLLNQYNSLSSDYNALDSDYRLQISNYKALQSDYYSLNSTRYSLQANYTSLQTIYDSLNQTYNDLEATLNDLQQRVTRSETALGADQIVLFIFVVVVGCLIAFIIYIKRKEPEPYVVIRKETVSVKKDEKT